MADYVLFVGRIRTPYKKLKDCPRNISGAGPECAIEIHKPFRKALMGLQEGDRIQIFYWLDRAKRDLLIQQATGSGKITGSFALRSPHRPNPIGVAEVEITMVEKTLIYVTGVDCLDKTPLLDIKPVMK